jgi:hypothetical protein
VRGGCAVIALAGAGAMFALATGAFQLIATVIA